MRYPSLTQFLLRKFGFKDMLAIENVFLVVVHVDEGKQGYRRCGAHARDAHR